MRTIEKIPTAERRVFEHIYETPGSLPRFQARVIIREGRINLPHRTVAMNSGVRVYVEGFRVLPYGDTGDDWLSLNQDANLRAPSSLRRLREAGIASADQSDREELLVLSNLNYHGAVFLADQDESELTMLVNREGFTPDESFEALRDVTRLGIDLTTRVRARYRESIRQERRKKRSASSGHGNDSSTDDPSSPAEQFQTLIKEAVDSITLASSGIQNDDRTLVALAVDKVSHTLGELENIEKELVSEAAMIRVLASVGLQMSAVVHELTAIAAAAGHLGANLESFAEDRDLDRSILRNFEPLLASARNLKYSIERQAAFLTDLVSADAKRRRSRQPLSSSFDSAIALVGRAADAEEITITNLIPDELKSPPMFKSEIVSIFTNLLTNAVKAAGSSGSIVASGRAVGTGM